MHTSCVALEGLLSSNQARPCTTRTPADCSVERTSADWASASPWTRPLTRGRSTRGSSTSTPISAVRRNPARTPAEAMKVFDGTQS